MNGTLCRLALAATLPATQGVASGGSALFVDDDAAAGTTDTVDFLLLLATWGPCA